MISIIWKEPSYCDVLYYCIVLYESLCPNQHGNSNRVFGKSHKMNRCTCLTVLLITHTLFPVLTNRFSSTYLLAVDLQIYANAKILLLYNLIFFIFINMLYVIPYTHKKIVGRKIILIITII